MSIAENAVIVVIFQIITNQMNKAVRELVKRFPKKLSVNRRIPETRTVRPGYLDYPVPDFVAALSSLLGSTGTSQESLPFCCAKRIPQNTVRVKAEMTRGKT